MEKKHVVLVVGKYVLSFKQMILHTILGHVLFCFYVVNSVSVLKPGERSRDAFTFQLLGNMLWLSVSVTGHFLIHPDSDLCVSLTSGLSSDVYINLFIIMSFVLNVVIYCVIFLFSIKIVFKIAEVEKQAKKKREVNWIVKLYFVILVNFLCGFVTDAMNMIVNLYFVRYDILLVVAIFPAIVHPLLLM